MTKSLWLLAALWVLLALPTSVNAAYLSGAGLIVTRLTQDTFRVDVPTFEILGWEGPYRNQTNPWGFPIRPVAGTFGVELRGNFGVPTLVTPVDRSDTGDGFVSVYSPTSYGSDLAPFAFEFYLPLEQQGGRHALSLSASAEIWSYSTDGFRDFWNIEGTVNARRTQGGVLPGMIGSSTSLLPVPEPGTWFLLASGLGVLGLTRRRRPNR